MTLDFDGLLGRLAQPRLAPVYLLAAEEPLQLQEAGDALRARARALGYNEREVLDVEAHFDWDRLARASASMSLFASQRLVELRLPTGKPDRDGAAAITEWCESPPPDAVLLVSAAQWSKKHEGAWVKSIERAGIYAWLRAPRLDQLPAWIRARMRAKGFAPGDDAIALLAERAEGNLLAIAQEIDKLAALRDGGPVAAKDVESLGDDNAQYDVFRLTDAAFGGDAARALKILRGLRAEGEELVPMLGWLLNQLDLALRLAAAPDFDAAARAEYGMWAARQQMFAGAIRRAGRGDAHWRQCLRQAARIDRASKGRVQDAEGKAMGDAWREMERLLVTIAQPRAAEVLLTS